MADIIETWYTVSSTQVCKDSSNNAPRLTLDLDNFGSLHETGSQISDTGPLVLWFIKDAQNLLKKVQLTEEIF